MAEPATPTTSAPEAGATPPATTAPATTEPPAAATTAPAEPPAAATEPQSGSDDPRVTKANREAQSYREQLREAQAKLQEHEDRDKTEQQKATERAEAAEKRAKTAESELLRSRVAAKAGLPADLAERLRGDTEEELLEDATALAARFTTTPTTPGDGLPRVPRGAVTTSNPSLDQQIAEAEGKGDWATAGALKAQKLAASTT